jgi:hypothetical protein
MQRARWKITKKNTAKNNFKMSATKHCNLCGQTKPLAEFYTLANGKPRAGCIACRCADSRRRDPIYYQAHKEACAAKTRRWQKRNPARFAKLQAETYRRRRDRGQTFLPLLLDTAPPAKPPRPRRSI